MPSWHMVKNHVHAKITNISTIFDTIIGDNIEEILFGCAVCANGPVVNKINRKPFIVTLNRKIKNKKKTQIWKSIPKSWVVNVGHWIALLDILFRWSQVLYTYPCMNNLVGCMNNFEICKKSLNRVIGLLYCIYMCLTVCVDIHWKYCECRYWTIVLLYMCVGISVCGYQRSENYDICPARHNLIQFLVQHSKIQHSLYHFTFISNEESDK